MPFNVDDLVQVKMGATWYNATVKAVEPTRYGTDLDTPTLYSVLYGKNPKYGSDQNITRIWVTRNQTGVENVDRIKARS